MPSYEEEFSIYPGPHIPLTDQQQEEHIAAYDLALEADRAFDRRKSAARFLHDEIVRVYDEDSGYDRCDLSLRRAESRFQATDRMFETYKQAAEDLMPPPATYYKSVQEIAKPTKWKLIDKEMVIEEISIRERTYNILKRNGVNTLNDLLVLSESQLAIMANFSEKDFIDVKETVTALGLCLRPEEIEAPSRILRAILEGQRLTRKDVVSLLQAYAARKIQSASVALEEPQAEDNDQTPAHSVNLEDAVMVNALEQLKARERRVIDLTYGLDEGIKHTQQQIASLFGISQTRIGQLKRNAEWKVVSILKGDLPRQKLT